MFTGLVEEKGTFLARKARGPGARIAIACAMGPLVLGESISVDGVCLTVDKIVHGGWEGWEADCSKETLARTTLGATTIGAAVNLERAVPLGGRMGGHIVSGHVDGVGALAERRAAGEALEATFSMPADLARYVAEKGSICVSGVSLTVNAVTADSFTVSLVPHTLQKTSLGSLTVGTSVNLEVDVLARYIARLLDFPRAPGEPGPNDATLREKLQRGGFM